VHGALSGTISPMAQRTQHYHPLK